MKKQIAFLLASLGVVVLTARCDSGTSDCTQTSTCPEEAGPDGPPPLECDTTKDPKDSPGCVDDRVGIFVSPTGAAGNPGTKEAPVQTIAQAIAATTTLKRIYACAGTYAEDVALGATSDGVSIYGGFQCSDWSYVGNNVTFGKGNIPLTISGTTKALSIEDVTIQAADGVAGNASSIAALVANASSVTFARVTFNAGKGAVGADGAATSNYSGAAPAGNNATGNAGGSLQQCTGTCTDTIVSTGGQGGAGGQSTSGGSAGAPNLGGGAAGVNGDACNSGGGGGDGNPATIAGADAPSPTALGTLAAAGWTTTPGANGKNGAPGQGGGGGAGTSQGGGAGGACGGCGGGGGAGGGTGGGSIALAVFSSTVTVNASTLHAVDAGSGGKGSAGQGGQTGGVHGNGNGCGAGNGGNGSAGGTGAGGVGGISVGVLYSGAQPTLDSASTGATTVGKAGTKGVGGIPGTNDGIDGVAQPVLQSP